MSLPIRLPGLDGMRAIAATFVLIEHVYQIVGFSGLEEAKFIFGKYDVGKDMVNLFFTISGFIITYTLLIEKVRFGTISLKNFYIKRSLRIWPIYFLLLGLIYFVSNNTTIYDTYSLVMYGKVQPLNFDAVVVLALFIANFNSFFESAFSILPHYWSISVEEQFYLIWPVLFKYTSPIKAAFIILVTTISIKVLTDFMIYNNGDIFIWGNIWRSMVFSNYGSMAIGAIGAWISFRKFNCLKLIFHPVVQITSWITFIGTIIFKSYIPYLPFIYNEVLAVLYLILILNVTLNVRTLVNLDNATLNKVGKVSFGLYLYHYPLIPVIIIGLKHFEVYEMFILYYQLPIIILVFVITYLIALFSFKFIEMPFLKLKPKNEWRFIHSVDQSKQ